MGKGASQSFLFFLNNKITALSFHFEKIKTTREGVFVFFIWFCCNSQVESGIFGFFNINKLLFKFGGGRRVLCTHKQVGVARVLRVAHVMPKLHQILNFKATFDAPH